MSKNRNKNKSEVEYLKGEIRRLKSELKYYKRRAHIKDDDGEVTDTQFEEGHENICPQCGKGSLTEHDFLHIIVVNCNMCDYEMRIKQNEQEV